MLFPGAKITVSVGMLERLTSMLLFLLSLGTDMAVKKHLFSSTFVVYYSVALKHLAYMSTRIFGHVCLPTHAINMTEANTCDSLS